MAVDVLTEVTIARSIDEVSAFASDPDNATAWYANIQSVVWQTSPPLTVGSRIAFVARFLGKRLAYTYEIVAFSPGERLVMRTAEGPFPMETTYTWEALSDSETRMSLRNQGEPKGFSRVVAPFMESAMRRANKKDLAQIKRILESKT
jgi:ligand-binding SRPBCC domain-containing protein